jgi:maltoporin
LSVRHTQDKFLGLGGSNSLWVQYAQGSAGLNSNFGSLTADSRSKSFRIVESFTWQAGALGGQAMALWGQDRAPDGAGVVQKQTNISVGARASYAFTKNFKLLGEAGYSQIKPEGAATKKLAKVTIAPTLSTGPGFWNRPELRLYVTHAKWNDPAGNVTGQPAFDGRTSGTSYGAQVEIWF